MTNAIHHTLILGMASFDPNFFESRFLEFEGTTLVLQR